MRIFEKRQRFKWWLYGIFLLVGAALITGVFRDTDGSSNFNNPYLILALLAGAIPLVLILYMQLETRIDGEGIRVKFSPFGFSEKSIPGRQWKNAM